MRCVPQHGSSRWTKRRLMPGSIASHATVAWSCSPDGTISTSPNANSTSGGVSCLPKKRICLGPSSTGATYGDAWVWIAFAPVWRLVLACVIGKCDQASADVLLARVAHVTEDPIPFFHQ